MKEDLLHLCECYVQYIGFGIYGENLRAQFHQRIVNMFPTKFEEEIIEMMEKFRLLSKSILKDKNEKS